MKEFSYALYVHHGRASKIYQLSLITASQFPLTPRDPNWLARVAGRINSSQGDYRPKMLRSAAQRSAARASKYPRISSTLARALWAGHSLFFFSQ